MYKNDEEITNEVVFTRLLRAMDCFSEDDVFDLFKSLKIQVSTTVINEWKNRLKT